MQEEVENRTVNLAVTTTKLTARSVLAACMKYLRHRGLVKEKKAAEKAAKAKENAIPHGKQTVKELIGQNQGVSNMDIAKTDLRGFEKVAQKYARDADALTAAFKEYSAAVMKKKDRPSVLKALKKMKELVTSIPDKVRNKDKEHTL